MTLPGVGDNFRDRTTGQVYTVMKMMKENMVMLESDDKTSRVLISIKGLKISYERLEE
jgi:hypothetical protein